MQVLEKYKTLEPLEAIDILIAPDNIRKKLKSENDIYKFEYCSQDEKTYKIASYIPLEWEDGKLVKVLLASMDVTQEKKAEIESPGTERGLPFCRKCESCENRIPFQYVP